MRGTKHILWRTFSAVILGLLVLFISSIMAIIGSDLLLDSIDNAFGIGLFIHSGMLVFSLLIIYVMTREDFSDYGIRKPIGTDFLRVFLVGLVAGFIVSLGLSLLPGGESNGLEDYFSVEIILGVWIYASVAEEVLTRGLIQGYLHPLQESGVHVSGVFLSVPVILGALFFGFMHLATVTLGLDNITVLGTIISAILLGLLAGYYREKSESLLPAILIHMLFNITSSIVGALSVLF